MKTAFKRSVILFLSLCIAFESISCGGGGYFMEYDMLFDRNFLFEGGKKTDSYNAWIYNEDVYNDASPKKQNAKSWAEYLENVYTENDLEGFIYRSPSGGFDKAKELKKLRSKRMSEVNISKKETLFLDFMEYALNVERVIAENTYDPWEEKQEINLTDFEVRINQGLEKIQQLQDAFMKERYAFQLIKLYRYSNQYNELEKAYKTYFSNSTSMLSYWAMEHYAGILAKQNKPFEANYYFIKVYTNCPSKRVTSYLSMKLETENDFKKTLNHCATTEEKMALHYVRSMQTKSLGLEDLKFITKSAGNHEYARIIMAHEINKLEQGKLLEERTDAELDDKLLEAQVGNYRKELIDFNNGMLAKEGDDRFWHLSLAYLYYLDGQHNKCSEILGKTHPKSEKLQKQHDIIFIINYLAQRETLTEVDENVIGNKLFSLNDNQSSYPILHDKSNEYDYAYEEYNTINEYIFKEIYKRYETKNAFLKLIFSGGTMSWDLYSEYSFGRDDSEDKVDAAYIDRVLNDLQKTPETRLALFAADHYFEQYNEYGYRTNSSVNFDQCEILLKEFKATLLMRDPDHLQEAVAIFSELPQNAYNESIYGDPFAFDLKNPNFEHYYENRYSLPAMSKYQFAKKLNDLNAKKSTAQDYYKLGMAYYNTSYYGLQWNAMAYHRTSSSPNGNYSMDVAQTFFKKALAFGGLTDEEKAKIYFMLARCEQNQYTQDNGEIPDDFAWYNQENEHLFDKYMQTMKESGAQSNFDILSKKYKKTRFYQEMIEECKYFGYYLN